jgi:isocitrate lyase
MGAYEDEIAEFGQWMAGERFRGTTRVYSPRMVVEQRGTVRQDYTVAREAAEGFYALLREMFAQGKSITSFGPYSPGQVVQMKRAGIQGIYLGGWATSAKGSTEEDPGPDLASYPLSQVPEEAANLIDSAGDERDQPFILGVTNTSIPSYKAAFLAIIRKLHDAGVEELKGHLIYAVSDEEYADADAWLESAGVASKIAEAARNYTAGEGGTAEDTLDLVADAFLAAWQAEAGLTTLGQAVADMIAFRSDEESAPDITVEEWNEFASRASWYEIRSRAKELGVDVVWDAELAQTPEGYYQVQGGIPYAIAKSLAAAPFADLLWMETKTADLEDAKEFADAVHAVYPDKMLAYNLSPSFNWDTTGMSDEEMRNFPAELGKMGFVFNFMTYGGHQIDGLAAEEFTTALREDGMLALARLQRKFRLLESPYRTPQTLVGGPRADAALMAVSGQTATTKAMGEGSTQSQHLVQTEVPPKILAGWLADWAAENGIDRTLRVSLRPLVAGSDLLELSVLDGEEKLANIIFGTIQDRRGRVILSVRDQNTFDEGLRRKRLMTLLHLFLIHRYKAASIHYLTPTDDNHHQAESMRNIGIFSATHEEVGQIIVAEVDTPVVAELVKPNSDDREKLIAKAKA